MFDVAFLPESRCIPFFLIYLLFVVQIAFQLHIIASIPSFFFSFMYKFSHAVFHRLNFLKEFIAYAFFVFTANLQFDNPRDPNCPAIFVIVSKQKCYFSPFLDNLFICSAFYFRIISLGNFYFKMHSIFNSFRHNASFMFLAFVRVFLYTYFACMCVCKKG
jgi:hypothetical protein